MSIRDRPETVLFLYFKLQYERSEVYENELCSTVY